MCTNLIINHRRGIAFALRAEDRGMIPDRDGPKSLKHVATAPQPNDQQQVCVTGPRNDHYKGLSRVTVGVAR